MHSYSTKNFTYREFIKSSEAQKYGINNEVKDLNIFVSLCDTMNKLQNIRDFYGKPILINSGYRCLELNKLVGGVPMSHHLVGKAVDFRGVTDSDTDFLYSYILSCSHFMHDIKYISKYKNFIHVTFK